MGMHLAICHGPVDEMQWIRVGDIEVWPAQLADGGNSPFYNYLHPGQPGTPGPITHSQSMFINSPGAFGGEGKEGGIQGTVDVCMGEPSQLENVYLRRVLQGVASNTGFIQMDSFSNVPPWTDNNASNMINGYKVLIGSNPVNAFVGHANQAATWSSSSGPNFPGTSNPMGAWIFTVLLAGTNVQIVSQGLYLTLDTVKGWITVPNVGIPTFRTIFCLVANQIYMAALNPYIKPWAVQVKRIQKQFDGSAQWQPTLAESPAASGDMNGAHIIRECLTNQAWGRGMDVGQLDDASFLAAAQQMFNEGMGLSIPWDQPGSVDDFINIILEHIDGNLYVDLSTNLWTLKLVRNDYVIANLPVFDNTNIIQVEQCRRPTPGDLVNQVILTYHDRGLRKDTNIPVQNIAGLQANLGRVNQQTVSRIGISNAALAQRIAMRELQSLSVPLLRATIHMNRTATALRLGSVFLFKWPEYNIGQIVMRVAQIGYGKLGQGEIVVSCVEDIFSLPATTYLIPTTTQWVSPNTTPTDALYPYFDEAPYYTLVKEVWGQTNISQVNLGDAFVAITGTRASQDSTSMSIYYGSFNGEIFKGAGPFCPNCRVPGGGIWESQSTLPFDLSTDMGQVRVGQYGVWENELVGVSAIDIINGTITVIRGVLDTLPAVHVANTRISFIEGNQFLNQDRMVQGQTLYAQMLPRTSRGTLAQSLAAQIPKTFVSRQSMPYPPGYLRYVNQDSSQSPIQGPTKNVFGQVTFIWNHRDRTQQTAGLIAQTAGSIGPEATATYTIQILNGSTVVRTVTGITAATWVYADNLMVADGQLQTPRFKVSTVRGAYSSFQSYDFTLTRNGLGFNLGLDLGGT